MARRELEYVGRSRRDLSKFPEDVQEQAVFALLEAQVGGKHPDAVPLRGFHGASVLEVRLPYSTDTYRLIYTIRFAGMVYVLHAFKKKSTRGIAMPQRDRDMIERRLSAAAELHARRSDP